MWGFWAVLGMHTQCPCFTGIFSHPRTHWILTGRQRVRTVDPILQMRKLKMEKALDQPSGHLNSNPLCLSPGQSPLPPTSYFLFMKRSPYLPNGLNIRRGRIFALFIHPFIHHSPIHPSFTEHLLCIGPGPNTENAKIKRANPFEKLLL